MCLELVTDGVLGKGPHAADSWHLARQIAPLVERHPDLEADLRKRYGRMADGPGRNLIENLLGETGDGDDVIEMVKSYIATGQAYNGQLARALRGATLWHEPVAGSENSYYVRPASVANLRRFLFGFTSGEANGMALAVRCLVEIDELRMNTGSRLATRGIRTYILTALGHQRQTASVKRFNSSRCTEIVRFYHGRDEILIGYFVRLLLSDVLRHEVSANLRTIYLC